MPKTKEWIKAYNKEYSSRPEVIAWAKERNARPERKAKRKAYKKTKRGKDAARRYRRAKAFKNPLSIREKALWSHYRITLADYHKMLEDQKGLCAICGDPPKAILTPLHVDHCHETGRIRGLLCGNCNRAIGLFGDDVARMKNAIEYLNGVHADDGRQEDPQPQKEA